VGAVADGDNDVTVLESERRAGGVIVTEQVQGFVVEGGADGFLAGEPELPALAEQLGIGIVSSVSRRAARAVEWKGARAPR